MEAKLPVSSKIEQRSVVRFLQAEGRNGSEILERLVAVYGENNAMKKSEVYRWLRRFKEGRTDVCNEARSGRPSDAVNEETINIVRYLLNADRRVTVTDIHREMATQYGYAAISRGSIHTILTRELEMRKVSARWVPRLLTNAHREARMSAALELLSRYHEEGEDFLSRIVTGDESWVHYWTPETKEASKVWKRKDEEAPHKAKQIPSAGKVMATVFWDHKGALLIEFLPDATDPHTGRKYTVNKDRYFDTLMTLRNEIRKKRSGLLTRRPILLHDNARPHSAEQTRALIQNLRWETFPHPAYSPDLAPSDYHAFPGLKKELGGKRFADEESLRTAVENFFAKMEGSWYRAGIEKLISRYDKCLNKYGDYVEK